MTASFRVFPLLALSCLSVLLSGGTASAAGDSGLVIVKAEYGDLPAGAKTDVTQKVAAAVKDGGLSIDASNDQFGDPAEGVQKTLCVTYTLDGVNASKTAVEGETLVIKSIPTLKIRSASYGGADVAAKLTALAKDNRLSLTVGDAALGKTPAANAAKTLTVTYTMGGDPIVRTVPENGVLAIPRVQIVKAVYGDLPAGGSVDVTRIVADQVKNDGLSVAAENGLFTDPAEGIGKTLKVDYTLDGVPGSKSVAENETLTIEVPAGK